MRHDDNNQTSDHTQAGPSVADTAHAARAAGLVALPVAADHSKAPDVPGRLWNHFKERLPTDDEHRDMAFELREGLGLVAGAISRLDCIDFDTNDVFEDSMLRAHASGLGALVDRLVAGYLDRTPGGGRRLLVYYPAGLDWKPLRLAQRPGRPELGEGVFKTLIELPAFAVIAPSHGRTHKTGRPYEHLSGDLTTIASYTADERRTLMDLWRSFDEMPVHAPSPPRQTTPRPPGSPERPGEAFARRMTWPELLEPAGWTHAYDQGEVSYWRRPGKDDEGKSASVNYGGTDMFRPFTTSTEFTAWEGYSKFGFYTQLYHGGDFSKAAAALRRQGYGSGGDDDPSDCPVCGRDACEDPSHRPPAPETGPPAGDPSPPRATTAPVTPAHWKRLDLADLATWPSEPLIPIVDGWFGRGSFVYVAAETQTGKTLLFLHVFWRCLHGGRLFGRYPVEPIERATYLVLEDPTRRIKARFEDFAHEFPAPLEKERGIVRITDGFTLTDPVFWTWLEHLIVTDRPQLLVLDTYQKATPGLESFDDKTQGPILHRLAGLTRRFDLTLVVIDHVRKQPNTGKRKGEIGIDDIKGSGGKAQNADVVILMSRTPDRKQLKVQCFGKDYDEAVRILVSVAPKGSDGPKFGYVGELGTGADQHNKAEAAKARVLEALQAGTITTIPDIAAVLEMGQTTVKRHIAQLIKDGLVDETGSKRGRRVWRVV